MRCQAESLYFVYFYDYDDEDEDLTRKIFGLTYDELTELLDAYAKIMGTYRDFYTYPKLTRSIKNTNFCDMTELWIPKTFPYVAMIDRDKLNQNLSLDSEVFCKKMR